MSRNIDLFDEYVAIIFSQLYESFPVKNTLDVRKLSGHSETDEFGRLCAPDGRPSQESEIAYATIEWLRESGYIRTGDASYPLAFYDCVLTTQGLEVLKAKPESITARDTVGDKLSRFVREGSLELAKDVAKSALTIGLGVMRP